MSNYIPNGISYAESAFSDRVFNLNYYPRANCNSIYINSYYPPQRSEYQCYVDRINRGYNDINRLRNSVNPLGVNCTPLLNTPQNGYDVAYAQIVSGNYPRNTIFY